MPRGNVACLPCTPLHLSCLPLGILAQQRGLRCQRRRCLVLALELSPLLLQREAGGAQLFLLLQHPRVLRDQYGLRLASACEGASQCVRRCEGGEGEWVGGGRVGSEW